MTLESLHSGIGLLMVPSTIQITALAIVVITGIYEILNRIEKSNRSVAGWMKATEERQATGEEAIRGLERELEFSQGYAPVLRHSEGMDE